MTASLPLPLPLAGVTVVDLTQFLAGPYASQILGDLGARVIKVEPQEPELARVLPPHFHKGQSAYYLSINRNKESVALNLRTEEGRRALRALIGKADILLENFKPGVARRLGMDFEELRQTNPRLVMCSISGFGQDGPYRDRPAYDIIVQAMSGGMSLTGMPGGEPVRAGLPLGDICAGMYAVIGVLAALNRARATGEGAYVDVAMLDCQIAMLSYQAAYYLASGVAPGLQGKRHDSIPTYRAFRCVQGAEIVVAANTEKMWAGLCEVVKLPELAADPRFATNQDRLANRDVLDGLLEACFASLDADEAVAALLSLNVPAARINDLERALGDPQVRLRGMVADLVDEDGEVVQVAGNPIKMSGMETPLRYPPYLGEHTRQALSDVAGLGSDEIRALIRDGAASARPDTLDP